MGNFWVVESFFIWNEQEYRNTKLGAEDRCADILIHV